MAIEFLWVFPLIMVIFHTYVSLQDGISGNLYIYIYMYIHIYMYIYIYMCIYIYIGLTREKKWMFVAQCNAVEVQAKGCLRRNSHVDSMGWGGTRNLSLLYGGMIPA